MSEIAQSKPNDELKAVKAEAGNDKKKDEKKDGDRFQVKGDVKPTLVKNVSSNELRTQRLIFACFMCLWLMMTFYAHRNVVMLPNSWYLVDQYLMNVFVPFDICSIFGVSLVYPFSNAQRAGTEKPDTFKSFLDYMFWVLVIATQMCAMFFYVYSIHKDTTKFILAQPGAIVDITFALLLDFIGFASVVMYVNIFE